MTVGIAPQPNSWLCGPVALKHALLTYGIFESEWAIARVAGATSHGADERDLARAARRFGCRLGMIRKGEPDEARAELEYHLARCIPTLLCVQQWEHWVVAMGHKGGEVVVFDSRETRVVRLCAWDELLANWKYDRDGGPAKYDMHPVEHRTAPWHARFTPERARWLQQPRHMSLARAWVSMAEVVLTLGSPTQKDGTIDLFARPFAHLISERRADLTKRFPKFTKQAATVLERLGFVAGTYGAQVTHESEVHALEVLEAFVASRLQRKRVSEVA